MRYYQVNQLLKFKEVLHDRVNVDINVSSPLSEIELDTPLTPAGPYKVWELYSNYLVSVGGEKRSLADWI